MKTKTAGLWIASGAAAFGLHLVLGRDSVLAEKYYARGFYAGLRWTWDSTLGLSPIPVVYMVFGAAVVGAADKVFGYFLRNRPTGRTPWFKRLGRAALSAAGWAGALVFFFYVLWGFNYNRIGLEKQLQLDAGPLDIASLVAEAEWATRSAVESRALIPGASSAALGPGILPAHLESELRAGLIHVLHEIGYSAPGRVRVRTFSPGGWMMRFSGSGIYVPYFGEGYAAGKVLAFEMPFTKAHEMAHGYGLTEEGEANFLALRTCQTSAAPAVRYSGFLAYWDYAAGELASMSSPRFKKLWAGIPEGVKADIRAQRTNWDRYRGPLEKISRKVYDKYLKAQGIGEGMKSYSRFVNLVAAWKKIHQ